MDDYTVFVRTKQINHRIQARQTEQNQNRLVTPQQWILRQDNEKQCTIFLQDIHKGGQTLLHKK